jgi:hypothetical protein
MIKTNSKNIYFINSNISNTLIFNRKKFSDFQGFIKFNFKLFFKIKHQNKLLCYKILSRVGFYSFLLMLMQQKYYKSIYNYFFQMIMIKFKNKF